MIDDTLDPYDPYVYHAKPTNVIDGDTIDAEFDLGHSITVETRIRFAAIDTREIHFVSRESEEFRRGQIHKAYVEEWLDDAADSFDGDYPLLIKTEKDRNGAYGRLIGYIYRRDCPIKSLNAALLDDFEDVDRYE